MGNKIKRNDPCFCGSGKKYKKCCISKQESFSEDRGGALLDFSLKQLRSLEGSVMDDHLIPYLLNELPEEIMAGALAELDYEAIPEEISIKPLLENFVVPWTIFNWIPAEQEPINFAPYDESLTVAMNYLNNHADRLSDNEKQFILNMNETYYSFYSVQNVVKDQYLQVKDLLLGTEHKVKEKMATHKLKKGELLYSRILTMCNQSIFVGVAPISLPPRVTHKVLSLKSYLISENKDRKLSPRDLRNIFSLATFDSFFEFLSDCYKPRKLVNTDGEDIQLCKSYFNLSTTLEDTISKIHSLSLLHSAEELLDTAELGPNGEIVKISFPWLKSGNKSHTDWDSTVMGSIALTPNKLTLETNSYERFQRGKKLLESLLGKAIKYDKMILEHAGSIMPGAPGAAPSPQIDPNDDPELKQKLEELSKNHWKNWVNTPVPLLNGLTPREATKTIEGLELLEVLLLDFENNKITGKGNDIFEPDVKLLREELGLIEEEVTE